MKINKIMKTYIVLFWLMMSLTANAESKQMVYEYSRQGSTMIAYLLKKYTIKEYKSGDERRIYLIELKINYEKNESSRETSIIQCSNNQPFYAFAPDGKSGMVIIDFLNPGGEMYGYNTTDHWTYWVVCHDLWQPWEYDLKSKAINLGYSTKLTSTQMKIPYEIFQYLKK
jgi:hypothetical protein